MYVASKLKSKVHVARGFWTVPRSILQATVLLQGNHRFHIQTNKFSSFPDDAFRSNEDSNTYHQSIESVSPTARPECSAGSVVQQLAGTPGGEVRARCSVTAPSTRETGPLRFYWTYNGTRDVLPVSFHLFLADCFWQACESEGCQGSKAVCYIFNLRRPFSNGIFPINM